MGELVAHPAADALPGWTGAEFVRAFDPRALLRHCGWMCESSPRQLLRTLWIRLVREQGASTATHVAWRPGSIVDLRCVPGI